MSSTKTLGSRTIVREHQTEVEQLNALLRDIAGRIPKLGDTYVVARKYGLAPRDSVNFRQTTLNGTVSQELGVAKNGARLVVTEMMTGQGVALKITRHVATEYLSPRQARTFRQQLTAS